MSVIIESQGGRCSLPSSNRNSKLLIWIELQGFSHSVDHFIYTVQFIYLFIRIKSAPVCGRASQYSSDGCPFFRFVMRAGQEEVGTKHSLTTNPGDHITWVTISKHGQPFQFPFSTNGKQYANDRLTDVSPSTPDSVRFFWESTWQIWQTLV